MSARGDFNKSDSHSNTNLLPDCLVRSDIIPSNQTMVFEAEAEEEEEGVSLSELVELKTRSENGGVPLDLMAPKHSIDHCELSPVLLPLGPTYLHSSLVSSHIQRRNIAGGPSPTSVPVAPCEEFAALRTFSAFNNARLHATDGAMLQLWVTVSNMVVGPQHKRMQVNRNLFVLLLARAKQRPLSVCLVADTRAANKLAPHMDHVRILELVHFSDPYNLDPLVRPAPAIEYLLLMSSPGSSVVSPRQFMEQAPVLFAGEAPSLRAIALINTAFLPKQPLPKLTDLYLSGMSKPYLQDLLDLLRGTPALESLAITDFRIPTGRLLFGGPPNLVPLARLRRFALVRTPLMRGMTLLEHLAVPREAAVHLLELFVDRNVDPLANPLPQFPPIVAANALEMVVCGTALAFRTRVRAVDGSVLRVPRAQCTAHRGAHTYRWWKALWRTLPCAHLTELRVAVDAEDDEVLQRFLDAAIALTRLELRLYQRDMEEWEQEMLASSDGAPGALLGVCALLEQELPVVCPCLVELAVIDASSTPAAWDGFLWGDETTPRVAYVPDILCVVAARAAAGRGLRRVALQGLWPRAQRERVRSAFAMGAMVTDFEFRELDAGTPLLFEFGDNGEEAWGNGYWTYELPKITLPWAPANGAH